MRWRTRWGTGKQALLTGRGNRVRPPNDPWDGDSLGEGASMMEPEIVKNRGLSRVSERRVRDDWSTLIHWVRWTDLEEGSISSCGSSRWVARL